MQPRTASCFEPIYIDSWMLARLKFEAIASGFIPKPGARNTLHCITGECEGFCGLSV
jgi:hypothetical protein